MLKVMYFKYIPVIVFLPGDEMWVFDQCIYPKWHLLYSCYCGIS